MTTYVLDASAVLRYLDNEEGADRVTEIIKDHVALRVLVCVSAIHWGEVAGILLKRHGQARSAAAMTQLADLGFELVPVTAGRAVRSAHIKVQRKIPYADAFGVELVDSIAGGILITADYDVKPASNDIQIEFLPLKPRP